MICRCNEGQRTLWLEQCQVCSSKIGRYEDFEAGVFLSEAVDMFIFVRAVFVGMGMC